MASAVGSMWGREGKAGHLAKQVVRELYPTVLIELGSVATEVHSTPKSEWGQKILTAFFFPWLFLLISQTECSVEIPVPLLEYYLCPYFEYLFVLFKTRDGNPHTVNKKPVHRAIGFCFVANI